MVLTKINKINIIVSKMKPEKNWLWFGGALFGDFNVPFVVVDGDLKVLQTNKVHVAEMEGRVGVKLF